MHNKRWNLTLLQFSVNRSVNWRKGMFGGRYVLIAWKAVDWGKHILHLSILSVVRSVMRIAFMLHTLRVSQFGVNWVYWDSCLRGHGEKYKVLQQIWNFSIEDFKDCRKLDLDDETIVDYLGFFGGVCFAIRT